MKSKEENDFMISTKIMKIIGFYQIRSINKPKVLKVNFFILLIILNLLIMIIVIILAIINLFYTMNNINNANIYLLIFVSSVLGTCKISCMLTNVDKIWNCIKLTSINNLSYKYHSYQILHIGRDRSKSISKFFIVFWYISMMTWWISPFIVKNQFMHVVTNNHVYYYRCCIMNFVFPVTDKFYNDNFVYYFVFEVMVTIAWAYGSLLFDVILISMSISFAYQLKTIANSYRNITNAHTFLIGGL